MAKHRSCAVAGCDGPHAGKGFCNKHYLRWRSGKDLEPPILSVEDRFWAKVHKTDGCWLWTGTVNQGKYGVLSTKGRPRFVYAHRLAFEIAYGYLPESVHHACEVKTCVNPAHLIGTTRSEHQSAYHVGDTCMKGHSLTDDNVFIMRRPDRPPYRRCRICKRETERRNEELQRERCEAQGHPARPSSKRGVCMCGWTTRVNQEIAV